MKEVLSSDEQLLDETVIRQEGDIKIVPPAIKLVINLEC